MIHELPRLHSSRHRRVAVCLRLHRDALAPSYTSQGTINRSRSSFHSTHNVDRRRWFARSVDGSRRKPTRQRLFSSVGRFRVTQSGNDGLNNYKDHTIGVPSDAYEKHLRHPVQSRRAHGFAHSFCLVLLSIGGPCDPHSRGSSRGNSSPLDRGGGTRSNEQ